MFFSKNVAIAVVLGALQFQTTVGIPVKVPLPGGVAVSPNAAYQPSIPKPLTGTSVPVPKQLSERDILEMLVERGFLDGIVNSVTKPIMDTAKGVMDLVGKGKALRKQFTGKKRRSLPELSEREIVELLMERGFFDGIVKTFTKPFIDTTKGVMDLVKKGKDLRKQFTGKKRRSLPELSEREIGGLLMERGIFDGIANSIPKPFIPTNEVMDLVKTGKDIKKQSTRKRSLDPELELAERDFAQGTLMKRDERPRRRVSEFSERDEDFSRERRFFDMEPSLQPLPSTPIVHKINKLETAKRELEAFIEARSTADGHYVRDEEDSAELFQRGVALSAAAADFMLTKRDLGLLDRDVELLVGRGFMSWIGQLAKPVLNGVGKVMDAVKKIKGRSVEDMLEDME